MTFNTKLTDDELRVLGALVEKGRTTPDYYPMTLNAVRTACNQKSNRDPVTTYTDNEVQAALDGLREKNLVFVVYAHDTRVVRYKHSMEDELGLRGDAEVAVLCVLMLRGPQTLGEIRGRTGRLHPFNSIPDVQHTIDGLMSRSDPLVARLPREPGRKGQRCAHRLGESPPETSGPAARAPVAPAPEPTDRRPAPEPEPERLDVREPERLDALEDAVRDLQEAMAEITQQVAELRRVLE